MSQDNLIASLSRELTVPIPENNCKDFFEILKGYISELGEMSLLSDKDLPTLPSEITDIISQISSNSKVLFPWKYLRPALIIKLKEVLSEFAPVTEDKQDEEMNIYINIDNLLLQRFKHAPPFTIQRICDLLSEPKKYYKTKLKYLRAFEKVLTVISHAKVHYQSPPLSSNSSEPKFSPPPKRLKQEISNASTIIMSSDSSSSTGKTTSGQLTHSFGEENLKCESKVEKECEKNENEQYLECSVSEADSTTVNELRSTQESNENREENEAKSQETCKPSKDADAPQRKEEQPLKTTETKEKVVEDSC